MLNTIPSDYLPQVCRYVNFWMPTESPNHIFVLLFSAENKVNSLIQLPKNRQKFVHCFFLIHKRQKILIMRMLFKMCGKGGVFPFLQSTVLYVGLVQRLITYLGIWRLTRNLLQLKVGTIEYLGIWNRFIQVQPTAIQKTFLNSLLAILYKNADASIQ